MPTIKTGARGTADLSTNRLVVDIASGISLLDPNENPMTYVSKKVGTVAAKQPKHSWLEDVLQPEVDQVNLGGGYTSVATGVVVDNISYYAVGDLVRVARTNEVVKVTDKSAVGSAFIVVARNYPGVGSTATGYNVALVDNDYLQIFSNVNEEGATSPTAKSTVEVQYDNYTQIVRTVFDVTETERNSLMNGEQDLPFQTRKKGIEHSRKLEYMFKFGLPGVLTGTNGKPERTAAGCWWFIKQYAPAAQVVTQAILTEGEFNDWLRACFRYGSAQKMLYAAPLILSAIEKWGMAKLNLMTGNSTYGLNITKWVSPHGTLGIVNDKMLEGPDASTNAAIGGGAMAFILDMKDVKYVPLRNRDTKLKTDIQANDADKYTCEYITEATMEIKLAADHGVLYGVTSFAA